MHYVASALSYHTPEEVEATFNALRDRCIHSVEVLDEILRESVGRPPPFGMLFVAEGLENEAQRRSLKREISNDMKLKHNRG